MFWLLMRTRLLSARNVVLETWRLRPTAGAALCLTGICLFGGVFIMFLVFFQFAARVGVLEETVYQAFYYLFMLLLAGAVPFVASTLLQAADYSLLFAAPIRPRTVVAAKLLDATVTNSLQFTVLGIPAIAACGAALNLPFAAWPVLIALILLFVLLPALLTAFALLLALVFLGMARLRAAITLINVLMGVVVCIILVLEVRNLPFKFNAASGGGGQFHASLDTHSLGAHIMPSAWFAHVAVLLARHGSGAGAAFGRIGAICAALFAACMALGGRLLSASSVVTDSGQRGHYAGANRDDARLWRRGVGASTAGMIVKDGKYIWRDTMLLSQLSVPLILFVVPYIIGFQNRGMDGPTELFPFAAVIITFILFIQTSIVSLSLLGMEAEGFWIVLNAPASRSAVLWAKWGVSVLLTGGMGVAMCGLAALSFHAGQVVTLAVMALIALCAMGLCALGVGISAALPRFLHDNPALRVSPWALIVSFFATSGYMLLTLLIFAATWIASSASGAAGPSPTLIGGAFGLHALLTLAVILAAMTIGARRLERYEWPH